MKRTLQQLQHDEAIDRAIHREALRAELRARIQLLNTRLELIVAQSNAWRPIFEKDAR